jgi:hypothetical protein
MLVSWAKEAKLNIRAKRVSRNLGIFSVFISNTKVSKKNAHSFSL